MNERWQDYKARLDQHTIVGDLRIYPSLYSPQLQNERDIFVWLPSSYAASGKRYPVLYMHDGRNLFNDPDSYSGEWRVDETMTALATDGMEAIIVGLPNQGELRRIEYNPYPVQLGGLYWEGRGAAYTGFIADTVKPLIDTTFCTNPAVEATGIAGSSMGGLISLYGYLARQDVFGFCGAFSPVFWLSAGLQAAVDQHTPHGGKIYLDIGGKEGEVITGIAPHLAPTLDAAHQFYLDGVRDLRERLLRRGYGEGDTLMYVEDGDAPHNESAWSVRFPAAMRFLLG